MKQLWQITKAEMHRDLTPTEIDQITDIENNKATSSIQHGRLGSLYVTKGGMKRTGWQIQPKISELVAQRNAVEQAIADGKPVPKDVLEEYSSRARL